MIKYMNRNIITGMKKQKYNNKNERTEIKE